MGSGGTTALLPPDKFFSNLPNFNLKSGADTQSRTGDLTLTKGALYQLSHISTHILFGDMLGITIGDIIQTVIIAGLVTLVISVKWRDFLLFSFDYQQAQASGLHTRWLHYGLLCMVSLTIVATLKAVGIILSISLLIAPGAIAVLLTQRFHIALLLATGISILVSMTGVWLSFFIDSAPAPTIVVLFAVMFIMTFTVTSINARTKENAEPRDLLSSD